MSKNSACKLSKNYQSRQIIFDRSKVRKGVKAAARGRSLRYTVTEPATRSRGSQPAPRRRDRLCDDRVMSKRPSAAGTSKRPRQPKQLGLQLAGINRPSFAPSPYQQEIFHFIVAGSGDGLIVAAAGAGKTATLVECAQLLRADKTLFLAFNRHIAQELQRRLATTEVEVLTVHGLGLRTIAKTLGDPVVDRRKYRPLVRSWIDGQVARPGRPGAMTDAPRPPVLRPEQLQDWYEALE